MKGLFLNIKGEVCEIISEPVVCLYDGITPVIEVVVMSLFNNAVDVLGVADINQVFTNEDMARDAGRKK
jgi:hypothetical protein